MPVEAARSSLVLGRALAASGDAGQAVRTLSRAEADFATVAACRERDLAARELRALGVQPPRRSRTARPRTGNPDRLSGRERQVAELVAAGRTNRQIAAQLHITENTVETHLRRIFAKLEVSSRAAVAALTSTRGDQVLPSVSSSAPKANTPIGS